jgi:hypothetical protein
LPFALGVLTPAPFLIAAGNAAEIYDFDLDYLSSKRIPTA